MVEFKADKIKKPKNLLILAEIVCTFLCAVILSAWRYQGFSYKHHEKGSYFGFLVAMAVCILLAKIIVLAVKMFDVQDKVPYFDVFNMFMSGAMTLVMALACILGAVASETELKFKTLQAGVAFGWFALFALAGETVLCYLELRK